MYLNLGVNAYHQDSGSSARIDVDVMRVASWFGIGGRGQDGMTQQAYYDNDARRLEREQRREERRFHRDARNESRTDAGRLQDAISYTISAQGQEQLDRAVGVPGRDGYDVPIPGAFNNRSLEDVVQNLGGWDATISVPDGTFRAYDRETPRDWRPFPGEVTVQGGTMTVREYVERFYDSYEQQNSADLSHVRSAIQTNLGVEIGDAPSTGGGRRGGDSERGQDTLPSLRFAPGNTSTLQLEGDNRTFPAGAAHDTFEERVNAILGTATITDAAGNELSAGDRGVLLIREFQDVATAEGADPEAVQRQYQEMITAIEGNPELMHNFGASLANTSEGQMAALPDSIEESMRQARAAAIAEMNDGDVDEGEGLGILEMFLGAIAQILPDGNPIREMIENWIGDSGDSEDREEQRDAGVQDRAVDGGEREAVDDDARREPQPGVGELLGGEDAVDPDEEEQHAERLENDPTLLVGSDGAASHERIEELTSDYLRSIDDELGIQTFEETKEMIEERSRQTPTDEVVARVHLLRAEQWLQYNNVEGVVIDGDLNRAEMNALAQRAGETGTAERDALANAAGLTGVAGSYVGSEPVAVQQQTERVLNEEELTAVEQLLQDNDDYLTILQTTTGGVAERMEALLVQQYPDNRSIEIDAEISDREAELLNQLQPGVMDAVNAIRENNISVGGGENTADAQAQTAGVKPQAGHSAAAGM